MFWPFGHFSTSWSLLGPFVHAIFGGSGGWTVFPVPSIFPGVQLNCWTLVIVGLPACRMARCTLCAALPGDPPGAIFNVGGDRNTMAVGANKNWARILGQNFVPESWAGVLGRNFGPEYWPEFLAGILGCNFRPDLQAGIIRPEF